MVGEITDFTCNGCCSNCGKCCNDILPVSSRELEVIRKYVKENDIKECVHDVIRLRTLDLVCPFRDDENKKCRIYPVRPEICRNFICNKPMPDIEKARRLFNEIRPIVSMRHECFGGEPLASIINKLKGGL